MAEPVSTGSEDTGTVVKLSRADRPTTPAWLRTTVRDLKALLALPKGWNSYQAAAIDPGAILAGLDLLAETMPPNAPAPSVLPMSRGGVQLEWHERGVDLEVSIDPDGHIMAAYEDEQGAEWEDDLTEHHARLAEVLSDLASRA